DKHCTLYKLAKLGGINKETLYQIKNGKDIKLSTIYDVCATFSITFKEFFDSPVFDEITD
ncbi:MAG: helix-turn-helix transcriptional regulator, partial [Clostridia bacterium]|nr:helix-turn-helix transcriptional regulator [Clostridia bacterium]